MKTEENNYESEIVDGVVVVSEVEPEEVEAALNSGSIHSAGLDQKFIRALSSWAEDFQADGNRIRCPR